MRSFPPGALTGRPGAPSVEVAVLDESGAVAATSTVAITLEMGPHPSGAQLAGTTTRSAVAGLASFDDLVLNVDGHGFVLYAVSPGLASASSTPFAFAFAPDPREPLGWGCATGAAASGLCLLPLALLARRRKRAAASLGALLSFTLLAPASARAQSAERPEVAQMRALYQQGLESMKAGRYDEALRLFGDARASFDSPTILYYIAECYRRAGRDAQAVEYYLTYIDRVPDKSKRLDTSLFEILRVQVAAGPL